MTSAEAFDGRRRMSRLLVLTACVVLAACGDEAAPVEDDGEMANPASVYCEQQGGTVEFRVDEEGGERGVCVFVDGSECDEWEFYRGDCEPGADTG